MLYLLFNLRFSALSSFSPNPTNLSGPRVDYPRELAFYPVFHTHATYSSSHECPLPEASRRTELIHVKPLHTAQSPVKSRFWVYVKCLVILFFFLFIHSLSCHQHDRVAAYNYISEFQLLHSPSAFHAERIAWRAVIYLNLVRSITRYLFCRFK